MRQSITENIVNLLQIFFEGVEARISAGVKPEEVGYQLAFSKQELRKVIKEYSGKEVKIIIKEVIMMVPANNNDNNNNYYNNNNNNNNNNNSNNNNDNNNNNNNNNNNKNNFNDNESNFNDNDNDLIIAIMMVI